MSYARWSAESDLYVYLSARGADADELCCCGCQLMPSEDDMGFHDNFYANNTRDFVAHIQRHIDDGYDVPKHMIDELWVDDIRNFS